MAVSWLASAAALASLRYVRRNADNDEDHDQSDQHDDSLSGVLFGVGGPDPVTASDDVWRFRCLCAWGVCRVGGCEWGLSRRCGVFQHGLQVTEFATEEFSYPVELAHAACDGAR